MGGTSRDVLACRLVFHDVDHVEHESRHEGQETLRFGKAGNILVLHELDVRIRFEVAREAVGLGVYEDVEDALFGRRSSRSYLFKSPTLSWKYRWARFHASYLGRLHPGGRCGCPKSFEPPIRLLPLATTSMK